MKQKHILLGNSIDDEDFLSIAGYIHPFVVIFLYLKEVKSQHGNMSKRRFEGHSAYFMMNVDSLHQ